MPTGSFQQYVVGATLFFVAILTGIIMSWVGGQLIDGFYNNELNDSLITYAQGPFYDATANMGEMTYFVNLFYLLCYILPILGCFMLWQSLVKYQSAEYYGGMFASGGDDGGGGGRRRRRRRS
jgi:uncharacterized membrane protein